MRGFVTQGSLCFSHKAFANIELATAGLLRNGFATAFESVLPLIRRNFQGSVQLGMDCPLAFAARIVQ